MSELVQGTVREWFAEEGWGVVDSASSPGGCFAHLSAIQIDGYRQLTPGQTVWIAPRQPGQDGCEWTTFVVSLDGVVDDRPGSTRGYGSTLSDALAVSWHELHGLDVHEVLAWTAEHAQGRTSVVYLVHRDREGLGLLRLVGTDPSAGDAASGVFHVFGDDR